MASTTKPLADGSSIEDAYRYDDIDLDNDADRWRFVCPSCQGPNWSRTNNHVWCRTCSRRSEHGEDVDPEHYELVDKKTGETVPWASLKVIDDE